MKRKYFIFILCLLLTSSVAHASVESSLLGLKSALIGSILPIFAVIGLGMDDLLFLDRDQEKLQTMAEPVHQWLVTHRTQRLNHDKTHLTNLFDGIDYLGYHLRQSDSSAQPLQVFSEPIKKWRWIAALKQLENAPSPFHEKPHPLAPPLPNKTIMTELASINSRLGTLIHARSYRLRKQSLEHFTKNTNITKEIPAELADPWNHFKIKKGYRAIKLR